MWDDTGCMGNRWGIVRVWGLRGTGGEYQDKTEERDLTWGCLVQFTVVEKSWVSAKHLSLLAYVASVGCEELRAHV